jgi:hypothetical protein
MPNGQRKFNDHDHRKTLIAKLATRIGTALCQSEYRHLGESEWRWLDRMQRQLSELRETAQ